MTTSKDPRNQPHDILESAQAWALAGDFAAAIDALQSYLSSTPSEKAAKRLLASIYELRALGEFKNKQR
jgi:hypothetical protein